MTEPPAGRDEARDEGRDEVVARALRELPVPEHRPSFWDDLDRALAEPGSGRSAGPPSEPGVRRLDTGELPAVTVLTAERANRPRRAPIMAAAAALVVLATAVGLVLVASGGGDGADDADLADGGSTATTSVSAEAAPTSAGTSAPATETTATAIEGTDTPEGAVMAWLQALGEGDTETAAAMVGERTVRYLESLGPDVTVEGFMAESEEGYGAWAGAPDLEVSATDLGAVELLDANLAIVTISGTHPGEGDPSPRFEAIPVVDDGHGWRIEHLAFDPTRDTNTPVFTLPPITETGLGTMGPADDVNVFVPANGTVFFRIDGGDLFADATSLVGTQTEPFALYNPPADLEPGTHQLVVVAVGDDDTIAYFGGTFVVEA